jgi:hypothetical protein
MGLFDKLKQVLGNGPKSEEPSVNEFAVVITRSRIEYANTGGPFYSVKVDKLAERAMVQGWPDKKRVDFIVYCVKAIHAYHNGRRSYSTNSDEHHDEAVQTAYLHSVLRSKLVLDDADIVKLQHAFATYQRWSYRWWPIGLFLSQVERQLKDRPLTPDLKATLLDIKGRLGAPSDVANNKDLLKLVNRVDDIIHRAAHGDTEVKPVTFDDGDDFSSTANVHIAKMPGPEQVLWYRLIALARKSTGSKPSDKFMVEAKQLIDALGPLRFKATVHEWFELVGHMKEREQVHTNMYDGQEYRHSTYTFLVGQNMDTIKGLAWMCANFHDARTITSLALLAERAYRKVPGQGPAAAAIGNACIYTLYRSKGLDGIGQLSRLKLRIKQASAVGLIDKYLQEAATEKGISVHEIEDLACDDHGLVEGSRTWEFDGFKATLVVTGPGRSELAWTKSDGTPQKSVPTVVKEKHAARLKKMKEVVKQVDLTSMAQRDRLDRMFRTTRKMALPYFNEHYLQHGLLSVLTRRIIWNFHSEGATTRAIWTADGWLSVDEQAFHPTEDMLVSLWHPAEASVAEVRTWRAHLLRHEIRQPLKQAFREVYLLTEAEVNTRTYSNRMAAHLLKQHQFNSLAKARGWRYALQGAFDNGYTGVGATVELPDHGLQAQFWINEVNADDAYNDTGIWTYVATDQLRFYRTGNDTPMDLLDVPTIAFSEVMRDMDLFVGVASVGNDPAWRDGGAGLPQYRDYWTNYSFGELGEVAKTRKEILSGLLPRLKIAKVASIQDKFLVVKGKLRTYKIHLGSTNILMEPNDQYLCIVPDRSKTPIAQQVFLPFEGDPGFSVILSKAFLLAEDDKITDTTITSQINRR